MVFARSIVKEIQNVRWMLGSKQGKLVLGGGTTANELLRKEMAR